MSIEIKSLEFSYGSRKAVNGISLTIPAGTMYGLVGPNGGGKTTLFKLLSTQLKPDAGKIFVEGINAVQWPHEVRKRLGVVFQSPALDKKLTVQENLRAQGLIYGLSGTALSKEIQTLAKAFQIEDRLGERVENLSGGLMRRVEIAKALLPKPSVLLLDEPTVGLDPLVRKQLWSLIRERVSKQRATVVFTTHLLEEAEESDELSLVDQGRVVATGSPLGLRMSVGKNLVTVFALDPVKFNESFSKRFSYPTTIVGTTVRISGEPPNQLVTEILNEFSSEVKGVYAGPPTLDDLFVEKTGRSLEAASKALQGEA